MLKKNEQNCLRFRILKKKKEKKTFIGSFFTILVHLFVFRFFHLKFNFVFQRLFLNTRKETVTSHVLKVGTIKTTTLDAIENAHAPHTTHNRKKKKKKSQTLCECVLVMNTSYDNDDGGGGGGNNTTLW